MHKITMTKEMDRDEDFSLLRSQKKVEKGEIIISKIPFIQSQTQSSQKVAFCCSSCSCFLGDLDSQLLRAKGRLRKSSEFITHVRQRAYVAPTASNDIHNRC
jgi:hypothetical protein